MSFFKSNTFISQITFFTFYLFLFIFSHAADPTFCVCVCVCVLGGVIHTSFYIRTQDRLDKSRSALARLKIASVNIHPWCWQSIFADRESAINF